MAQVVVLRCDCCGQPVNPEENDHCSHCQYPIGPVEEERFLEESLRNLRRVAVYGGAYMTVTNLIRRYETRLHYLQALKNASIAVSKQEVDQQAKSEKRPSAETSTQLPVPQSAAPMPSLQELPEDHMPSQEPIAPTAVIPAQPSTRVSFLSALSSDALVNIIASLGGFFVLVGALGFITTTSNLLLAFLVVFSVHAIFGAAGLITHRFPSFRMVSGAYTIIFALLVPLVGFSAYRLVANNLITLSVPTLIALAALYAAVTYTMLALVQRFTPFAYLGLLALLVADLAVARAFQWGYWWWPVAAMVLAFPALSATIPSASDARLFNGPRAILRTPTLVLMYSIVTASWISGFIMLLYSLPYDAMGILQPEARFSLFVLALLLSGWTALLIWQTRNVQYTPVLAYLLLMCVLSGAYVLNLDATGYALGLTGVALFYVGLNHTAGRLLAPLAPLSLTLDQVALVIAILVPFISSPRLPLQLFAKAFTSDSSSLLNFSAGWQTIVELVAVALCFVVTLDITFRRAGFSKIPANISWCWLLMSGGFLLAWEYSLIVLLLNFEPVWAFVILTLVLIAVAVAVRRSIGAAWAKPLDLLAVAILCEMLILSLSQNQDTISALLLGFATILYGVLLYQRRSVWLFLSFGLALLALPLLAEQHPPIMLLMGLLLPFAAVLVRRFVPEPESIPNAQSNRKLMDGAFERPLLIIGLLSGIIFVAHDLNTNTGAIETVTGHHFPIALQIASLGLAWFGAAMLARMKLWLFPAVGFVAVALLIPTNNFGVLTGIALGAALLGIGVSRVAGRDWALPFYSVALLSACMSGYTGIVQGHVAATGWVLLGFAVLAYGIGITGRLPLAIWIMPVLATWAVIDATSLQGDLYRAPIVALVSVGLGIGVRLLERRWVKTTRIGNILPFYATACASMLLTGFYGALANINHPFYGAIPDALLVYAIVAFAVAIFEQQPQGNWLTALFAIWGTILALQLTAPYMLGIGISTTIAGVLVGRKVCVKQATTQENAATDTMPILPRFTWSGPWYGTALLAAALIGCWPILAVNQPDATFIPYSLLAFTVVAAVVTLVEQTPELMLIPVLFAVWTIGIWQPPLALVPSMVTYSLLCLLIFASQFVWLLVPARPGRLSATRLCNSLAIGGQSLVVLAIIGQGGLAADMGTLVHVGACALLELALLLFLSGIINFAIARHRNAARSMVGDTYEQVREARMQRAQLVLHWCNYVAGLLFSLVISWELIGLHQTRFDVLTLAPASYLIVIAPFLMRDQTVPERHIGGQIAALVGAALLLLPALWFSFSDTNLVPTLILVGESLLLLLLGMITRLRIFILSSAALVVIGTLRILFLSIPPSLPLLLMAFGTVLVVVATGLIRARRRLQVAWTQWE